MSETSYDNDTLFAMNGLKYAMPQELSVAVNKTYKREFSQRQQYSQSDTMVFDINSGSAYVDPCSCFLSLDLTVTAGANAQSADRYSFGTGSVANLFSTIRLLSKNGCEIDRTQDCGVLAKILKDYTVSAEGQKALSASGNDISAALGDARVLTVTNYVIPLSAFSGFFRPLQKGMLIPSGLASGLRIEIVLESAARALTKKAGNGTAYSYSVTNPTLFFNTTTLNDGASAVLMKESAENGLEYTFPSYFSSNLNTVQTSSNIQVKKAVAQCTRIFSAVYDVSGSDSVLLETKDGYKSIGAGQLTSMQFRVGSNYYPQQAVTKAKEAFYVSESTFGKITEVHTTAANVSIAEYETGGKFLVGTSLESNGALNLSGVPLNNSNVAELRLGLLNGSGLSREIDVFIEFITVARTFINRTSIKI